MAITPLPTPPSRGDDPTTFRTDADAFLGALPTFATEVNALAVDVGNDASAAAASAAAAAASETAATGAANYQGDYDAGTLYAVGESVSYTGSVFVKKTTAPAGTTPVDGTDWLEIGLGLLSTASTSGASQEISFAASGIHNSEADAAVVTYTFTNASVAAKVDLVIDYPAIEVFNITTASYSGNSFSVAVQVTNPLGLAFNTDGTKMFVVGNVSDTVYEYTLSTGFNITTASYSGNSFSVAGQDAVPADLAFNTDGTKMFVVGNVSGAVYEYTLSTGFNITTASYSGNSFSVAGQETNPLGLAFNTDGTKMFVVGNVSDTVYEYTLSTGFNITTASYSGNSFSVAGQDSGSADLAFNTDGTKMFVLGNVSDAVYEYTLSTGFNITTASYSGNSFSVAGQDSGSADLAFNTDGTKMFVLGNNGDAVYEYTCTAGPTLIFPTMEKPAIPLRPGEKTALSIVTSDTGSTYQVVSAQGGIV